MLSSSVWCSWGLHWVSRVLVKDSPLWLVLTWMGSENCSAYNSPVILCLISWSSLYTYKTGYSTMYSRRIPADFWGSLSVDPFCFLPAALTVNFLGSKIEYLKNLEFPCCVSPLLLTKKTSLLTLLSGHEMFVGFSLYRAIFSTSSWVSCNSVWFWQYLPDVSVRSHRWRAQSHRTAQPRCRHARSQLAVQDCHKCFWPTSYMLCFPQPLPSVWSC